MASQKMIFLLAIFLIGYVSAEQCKVDRDCDHQAVTCTDQDQKPLFCFEGECYCPPWPIAQCHTDDACERRRSNDCRDFKSVCTHGLCLCSKHHKINSEASISVHH
ncbi:hypothetical protein ACP275_12G088800 [Erythranthe tilingii]